MIRTVTLSVTLLTACVAQQPQPVYRSTAGQPQAGQPQAGQPQPGQPQAGQPYVAQPQAGAAGQVFINGVAMSPADAQAARIPAGRYWYDRMSGLWGVEGGPTLGVTQAGLNVGGQLQANASNGTSNVFVNGRNLQLGEVAWLQNLLGVPVQVGRYWLDFQGNMGVEGGPPLVNLMQVSRSRGADNFWSNGRTNAVGNESGGAGYVCVPGGCPTYGM
jgi:hypothetical protein